MLQGWAKVHTTGEAAGLALMQRGVDAWKATGARVSLTLFAWLMAEAYGRIDQPEPGLAMLDDAIAVGEQNGEHSYEAELHRVKGELLHMLAMRGRPGAKANGVKAANASFRTSLTVARDLNMKGSELRSAPSARPAVPGQPVHAGARLMR